MCAKVVIAQNDTDCGMYIPLSDDKHRFVRDSSKKHTGNPRQIQSETKFSLRKYPRIFFLVTIFFSNKIFFPIKNFSDKNFVLDWICHGLNFVSSYMPQLYFCMQSFNLSCIKLDINVSKC